MRRLVISSVLIVLLLLPVSGCGGGSAPPPTEQAEQVGEQIGTGTPTGGTSALLNDEYEDALSVRNQLALGTLRLAAEGRISAEQAGELLLYWQALKSLAEDSTTASEETEALQNQILEAMTPEQVQAIAAMRLTNADLNEFYAEQGVEVPTPQPGVTPQSGKNSGLSPEDREATRTAAEALGTPVGSGGQGGASRRDVLLDTLITTLEGLAGQ